jgi:4-aminobutyrate aminotransferase
LAYIEDIIFKHLLPPEEVAAIVVEPIQGDAGIIVPPDEYLPKLKELCEKFEILFIAEEIQTGFGRTGEWFAVEHWEIEPDILVLGKAIASGMPLSALVAKAPILESLSPPADLLTCKGNPICCEAALATIEVIRKENLVEKSKELGEYMKNCLLEMKEEHELIGDVRGKGLSVGVDLVKDRKTKRRAKEEALKVCWRSFEKGLLLVTLSESVLRIQPPLVITKEEIDTALNIIDQSLREVEEGKVGDEILKLMEGW